MKVNVDVVKWEKKKVNHTKPLERGCSQPSHPLIWEG